MTNVAYTQEELVIVSRMQAMVKQWKKEKARAYDRLRYAENIERNRAKNRRWYANNPEKARQHNRRWCAENIERRRENQRRRRAENPERYREPNRRWSNENPEHRRENLRRWRLENPEMDKAIAHRRRARKLQVVGDFTAEQFNALCAHFKYHCLKCGRPRKLTPDHVIPLAWSERPEFAGVALNDIDNIQPLCKPCNSSKNATHVDYRITPHQHCINPPMVEDYLA